MKPYRQQISVQPPFLDLILDDEPELSKESFRNVAQQYRTYKLGVIRDLEQMLNSKCNLSYNGEALKGDIMFTYGVDDFTHINISALSGRDKLRQKIIDAIRENEPRLQDINVVIHDNIDDGNRLNFRIEAKLCIYADSDPFVLNASFEPARTTFNFQSSAR
ncbi:MAG: type VI secretion system baseplate subunit TssE [Chromatiales bacterium]|nr:type VI secretion system baseplate subunit TssE [Chromatiales bacterium]